VNDRFDGYLIANKSIPYSNEWQNTIFTINLNQEAQWVNITYISSFNASEPTIDAFAIDNIVIKKEVVQSGDYNIHIAATQNGSVTANTYLAAEGETITLAPAPNSGYELESLTVSKAGGGAVEVSSNQFVMPADNVVVTATFKPIQSGTEQISAESLSVFVNNRTVSVENAAAEVFISDIGGRIVAQGAGSGEYEVAQAGVYIVRAGAAVRKVVVK
jgi:hypothetical protein